MTIHLSRDIEDAIHAAVRSGRFASADEMVASLVRDDASRHPAPPATRPVAAGTASDLGSIGAMRDSADELDEIVAEVYRGRQRETWRDLNL